MGFYHRLFTSTRAARSRLWRRSSRSIEALVNSRGSEDRGQKRTEPDVRERVTEGGGRSSPGPADAAGTIRLMPFLPDDAPSPSQAH
jgi:hypothetical protein